MTGTQTLRKAFAFLKRDFLINTSYRMAFLFDFASIVFSVLTFFFIAKIFGEQANTYLSNYGGNYFSFVLVGIAFSSYLSSAMGSFTNTIREGQYSGTLETIILSPTKISTFVLCGVVWDFLFSTIRVIAYLFVGWVLFRLDLSHLHIGAFMLILALTITSFSGLGILSASFILVYKKGDPVNWLFSNFSRFFGGVYFPVSVMPLWMQKVSWLLPVTYSLEAMRKCLVEGTTLRSLAPQIFALLLFSLLFLPLSIFCFKIAINRAKKDGSLIHY